MRFHGLLTALAVLGLAACGARLPRHETGWDAVPGILEKIKPPSFPELDFRVTDYGAVGDGETDCTGAIGRAIDACRAAGGGRVVVPEGTFLTGAVHLKSRVNLHLQKNATLLFSRDIRKYLPVVFTRFEGIECMNYSPLIYAHGQEDLAVTGEGTLDGGADSTHWWPWAGKSQYGWAPGDPDPRKDRLQLFQMAEEGVPVAKRVFGEGRFLRVNFIQFYQCENVLIEGVTILRSPMWVIHPVLCENVTVQGVRVDSHGPNNDGCDPESSRNVLIQNCFFDTGDDCIAVKSGRNGDGRRVGRPSENIIVRGCTMKDGHGGVVIGSEISGSCRNVFVENCGMDSPNLERVLRIKTNSRRGGVVENIYMRDVRVGEVSDAVIGVYFNYEEGDVGSHTPIVRNIHVSRLTSLKSDYALSLDGYERSPISGVFLQDCTFDGVRRGTLLNHVSGLVMKNVRINGELQ